MLLATGACETATPSAAAGIVRTAVRVARECGSVAVFRRSRPRRPAWRALRLPGPGGAERCCTRLGRPGRWADRSLLRSGTGAALHDPNASTTLSIS